jgi:hypothetical protein
MTGQFVRRQRAPSLHSITFGPSSFPLQQPFPNPTTNVVEPVIRPECEEPSGRVTLRALPVCTISIRSPPAVAQAPESEPSDGGGATGEGTAADEGTAGGGGAAAGGGTSAGGGAGDAEGEMDDEVDASSGVPNHG